MNLIESTSPELETSWMDQASCKSVGPEVMHPEDEEQLAEALAVCGACAVKQVCLDYAIEHSEKLGIWGGATPVQRRRIVKYRAELAS